MKLSFEEIKRYSRHILLPEIGEEGQQKLKKSSVLVVGVGGLGAPLVTYLASSGVGQIGIVDYDVVDESNLQRQILFSSNEVGRLKTQVAKERLLAINPLLKITIYDEKLTHFNAADIIKNYDVVADGTDNFSTRYLVNDVCMLLNKPNVYASVFGFEGQASVFLKGEGPCYRCLFPNPPDAGSVPSCNAAGVLGVLPGILGTIQATEVIKLLLRVGDPLIGRLLRYNALEMRFDEIGLQQNANCPVCGNHPTITELIDYEEFCRMGPDLKRQRVKGLEPKELKQKIESGQKFLLLDVRESYELDICQIPGAVHIPMGEIQNYLHELTKDDEIVVYCHLGVRSKQVAEHLIDCGISKVYNLEGGIDSYAQQCDKSILRY